MTDSALAGIRNELLPVLRGFSKLPEEEMFTGPLRESGIDSLTLTEAVFEIEERYEISIEDADLEKLTTLDDLVALVCSKVIAGGNPDRVPKIRSEPAKSAKV